MSITRRSLASLIAVAACLPFAAAAQEWPAKPIRIVVPFAAGGTSDILARALGERLQAALKQTVIIDNKAGAGGVIGADSVAKSAPDGTTFLLGTIASHAINPVLNPKMPYDAAKDFAPVILLGSISNVLLVGADQPYRNVKELIAAVKAKPGMPFASAGQGSSQHMSGEAFRLLAGVELTHVPYKGSAPAIQDVIGGQIPMSFETATVALPHIQSGKVRALAVTSAKRSKVLPDTPTLQEAGVAGFDVSRHPHACQRQVGVAIVKDGVKRRPAAARRHVGSCLAAGRPDAARQVPQGHKVALQSTCRRATRCAATT
jgi:tripartite-type tricarboxylate transporter receptor subunit TctC